MSVLTDNEPIIAINGHQLTLGQAMTVRVAVTSLHAEMVTNGLGNDDVGKGIAEGYIKCCEAIFKMIFKSSASG
jgi:hypothetical protein